MTLEAQSRIICAWMEPEPEMPKNAKGLASMPGRWWRFRTVMTVSGSGGGGAVIDMAPILEMCDPMMRMGYLHEVEERLQVKSRNRFNADAYLRRNRYMEALSKAVGGDKWMWHATAEQKIAALAGVLTEIPMRGPTPFAAGLVHPKAVGESPRRRRGNGGKCG